MSEGLYWRGLGDPKDNGIGEIPEDAVSCLPFMRMDSKKGVEHIVGFPWPGKYGCLPEALGGEMVGHKSIIMLVNGKNLDDGVKVLSYQEQRGFYTDKCEKLIEAAELFLKTRFSKMDDCFRKWVFDREMPESGLDTIWREAEKMLETKYAESERIMLSPEQLDGMTFVEVRKKTLPYTEFKTSDLVSAIDSGEMPRFSYAVNQGEPFIVGKGGHGKDIDGTAKTANTGDVVMCGPNRENYTMSMEKFKKNYIASERGTDAWGRAAGPNTVIPEQSPRMMAKYGGVPAELVASWGEKMVVNPGDYIIKEGQGKFYRIREDEGDLTYDTWNLKTVAARESFEAREATRRREEWENFKEPGYQKELADR